MDSASKLTAHDRCTRAAHLARDWERNLLLPDDVLRRAIDAGLESEDSDPGQAAGDAVMTLCTERGMQTARGDLYAMAQHIASLADIVTWVLRGESGPWQRPEDTTIGKEPWVSSCFLHPSGTKLRRVVVATRWSEDRALSEAHNWKSFGEACIYGIPVVQTVVVVGQNRDGRHHGPFSSAWTHPVNHALRMRKRSGKGFDGQWVKVWREETEFSREKWLDAMTADGVLGDVLFEVEVEPHTGAALSNIGQLAARILAEIREAVSIPEPRPSQCHGVSPCQFVEACWRFETPTERNGFIRIGLGEGSGDSKQSV